MNLRRFYPLLLLLAPILFFFPAVRMQTFLGDGDAYVQFLPFWKFAFDQWAQGVAPLWSPHIFSGFPLFAEPQAGVFHPIKILFWFLTPLVAFNWIVLIHHGLAGLWTYLLARREAVSAEGGLLAGLAFQFSGFLMGHQGITALFLTISLFPALFYALRRLLDRPDYGSIFIGAAVILWLVLSGHPQFFFYALFFGLFYALWLGFFELRGLSDRLRYLRMVLATYFLGVLLAAFQLLPTVELTLAGVRSRLSYEDFVGLSLPWQSLLSGLLSTKLHILFAHDGSESTLYLGILVLLAAGAALMGLRHRPAFWALMAFWSALLWLGDATPLYRVMYWVPGYNLFRLASRNGILLTLALCMLAAWGLTWLQERGRMTRRRLGWAVPPAIAGSFFLYNNRLEGPIFENLWRAYDSAGAPLPWALSWLGPHLLPVLGDLLLAILALASLIFLLLRFGLSPSATFVFVFLAAYGFWQYRNWVFVAPFEETADSLKVRPLLPVAQEEFVGESETRMVMATPTNWIDLRFDHLEGWRDRYAEAGGVSLNMLSGHASASGYTPLILKGYSQLAGEMHMSGKFGRPDAVNRSVLQLLNVGWVHVPKMRTPAETIPLDGLVKEGESAGVEVYRNPAAPGYFWSVSEARGVLQPDFWKLLESDGIDFGKTALVAEGAPSVFYGVGRVQARHLDGNTIEVWVDGPGPTFIVGSLPHYPGWKAFREGEPVPLQRVNGIFTGFELPAGRHRVLLRFLPNSLLWGLAISLLGLIAAGLAARWDWLRLGRSFEPKGSTPRPDNVGAPATSE